MSLLSSNPLRAAALALTLALATSVQAAMPLRPVLHVATLDGHTFDLAAQRGHWVIVNYWATWCAPCIKEMPDISHFVASHSNVRAIGLAYDDSAPADIRKFLLKHPVVYPIARTLRWLATKREMSGISLMHGTHQVAQ